MPRLVLASLLAPAPVTLAEEHAPLGKGASTLTTAESHDRGGPALPTSFQILSFDAGGTIDGATGAGFTTADSRGFYRDPSLNPLNVLSPAAASLALSADREYHSYFGLDPLGPSAPPLPGGVATRDFYADYPDDAHQALNSTTSPFLVADPASSFVEADADPGAPARAQAIVSVDPQPVLLGGTAPGVSGGRSEFAGLFLARLTVGRGAPLSGGASFVLEGEDPLAPETVDLTLDGALVPAMVQTDQGLAQVSLGLRSFLIDTPMVTGFGEADLYDVWLVACNVPVIVLQPANQISQETGEVTFSVVAEGPNLTYQWRRAGVELSDGPAMSGVATPNLTVSDITFADALRYDVVISAPCGSTISQGALLTVEPLPCAGDANSDRIVNFSDITTVLAEWLKQCD